MEIYLIGFSSTLLTAWLLVLSKGWHGRFSMDSTAGPQKFHTTPTTRIGGVAIAVGLISVYSQAPQAIKTILAPMLLAGIPALGAGLLEDITKKVGVLPRLLATMLSGAVAWYLTGIVMRNTGIPLMDWLLAMTPVAVLFTAFAVGGVANAVNIIDGFNGLAAGAAVIMLGALGLIASNVGDEPLATVCFVIAAVVLGFGTVNWPRGNIFFGDGGAYLVGFLLAWLAVLLPMRNPQITAWATMLVCAYPVLEVGFSYRRKSKREGHHPGQPDKVHFHMLVHRRVARPLFAGASSALKNGFTSPFCWIFAALPAGWAVIFSQNIAMLAFGFVVAIFTYATIYARLTQFRWCLPLFERKPISANVDIV